MPKFNVIHFNAGNDTNGNPRRVFVVFNDSAVVATYDEGYAGYNAITNKAHLKAARRSIMVPTTPAQYRAFIAE